MFHLLTLALLPVALAGTFSSPVIELDAASFRTAMATEHAAMTVWYAPWCGHCKNLAPEWTAAAQSLAPLVPWYSIDCDNSKNKALCAEYGIQGFPTIKAFPRAGKGAAREVQVERKRGPLIDYAKGLVPDRVKKLRVDDGEVKAVQKFMDEKASLPHALLVHPSQPSIPFMWKVLGHRLASRMHLGYIRDTTDHKVLSSLGAYDAADTTRDATRVVFWQPGAERAQVTEYDGAMKFNALLEWLQSHLDNPASPPPPRSSGSASEETAKADTPPADKSVDAKAARQAKLDEAERRDRARREKMNASKSEGSKVEDAPEPLAAEGVSEGGQVDQGEYVGGAAEPVPEAEVSDRTAGLAEETGHVSGEL